MMSRRNRKKQAALAAQLGKARFLEEVAERFKLLGEPMRLRLIQALIEGEKTVTELVGATGGNQANVSRHLNHLTRGGVLTRRKEGLHVYYRVADRSILKLCDLVCGSLQAAAEERVSALRGGR